MRHHRSALMSILSLTIFLALACGQSDSGSGSGSDSGSASSPAASQGKSSGSSTATVQEISALGQKCVELVKSGRYADAIDPCERAITEGATADVEKAYAEAKAAVKREATKAAAAMATDGLEGDLTKESAKETGLRSLRNLSGEKD